jgi:hypothetical protein
MGTFGTGILQNDTSVEVYDMFTDLIEQQKTIPQVIEVINNKFQNYKNDEFRKTDFLFAFGLCLWENCALDSTTFNQIKEYILSDADILIWQKLDANEADIKQRKRELAKFLKKIEVPRSTPLLKKKKINKPPIFEIGDCITFKLKNGNYGGAIVLAKHGLDTHYEASNVIISTDINQFNEPNLRDYMNSNVMLLNFGYHKNSVAISSYESNTYFKFKDKFTVKTKVEVNPEIQKFYDKHSCGYSPWWNKLYEEIEEEFANIKRPKKIRILTIKEVLLEMKLKETLK